MGVCAVCGSGTFSDSDFSPERCWNCAAGHVTGGSEVADHDSPEDCSVCPPGTYAGVGSCIVCADGYYSHEAASACSECPGGSSAIGTTAEDHAGAAACLSPPAWNTLAGDGFPGNDDAIGTFASFRFPMGVAVDPGTGALFVSEESSASGLGIANSAGNNVIRRIDLGSGVVSTLTGVSDMGVGFLDGAADEAFFSGPQGLAVASGVLYVADTYNNAIRTVSVESGAVTTLAGGGPDVHGCTDGTGAGAAFLWPTDVAADPDSGTLFVADMYCFAIRMVAFETGVVGTLAGGSSGFVDGVAADAQFDNPKGVAYDPSSNVVYVADSSNHAIRRVAVDTGAVTTFAGGPQGHGAADGVGTLAQFFNPWGITFDRLARQVIVADWSSSAIRGIDATTALVRSLGAGEGAGQNEFNDGTGTAASFYRPTGVAVHPDSGAIYVADKKNHAVRTTGCPDTFGGTSHAKCRGCGLGEVSASNQCIACYSGQFTENDFTTNQAGCTGCPVGRYLDDDDPAAVELHDHEEDCAICEAGQYAGTAGTVACEGW